MPAGTKQKLSFRESRDPATDRAVIQLTGGEGFTYPLYYFIPSTTEDGRHLIFYRYANDEVQNYRLDLQTGEEVQLTAATTQNCLWRFWDFKPAIGVREFLSSFNTVTDELVYFDSNTIRAVNIHSLVDRVVCELDPARVPCGLTGVSPDGKWLVFPHADRTWWEAATQPGPPPRHEAKRTHLTLVDLAGGAMRPLVVLNTWITHAHFCDNERIYFSHMPTECSLLVTDLRGGHYTHLRTQTVDGIEINHKVATRKGIMYETVSPGETGVVGICDPATTRYTDYRTDMPVHHIGRDREARLWFAEPYFMTPPHHHIIAWLPKLEADKINPFVQLSREMTLYGNGQRSHIHPTLTNDRKHILHTGPDERSRSNHMFLLDVSDLPDTTIVPVQEKKR